MVSKLTLAAHKKQLWKLRTNRYIHLLLSNSQGEGKTQNKTKTTNKTTTKTTTTQNKQKTKQWTKTSFGINSYKIMNLSEAGLVNSRHIFFLSSKKADTANKIEGTPI